MERSRGFVLGCQFGINDKMNVVFLSLPKRVACTACTEKNEQHEEQHGEGMVGQKVAKRSKEPITAFFPAGGFWL